jgi:ubiquinone/menaquinone biosynthesis C-methylase UbiE
VLAAAGALVSVLDNSPAMLELDRQVAAREDLPLETHLGDMADLSVFPDASFDLVVHPVSNCFVPEIRPVWREAHRVLKPGARLLAGFMNPCFYIFDSFLAEDHGELKVCHALPYADATDLPPEQRQRYLDRGEALEFSHTLTDQLAGQLEAGFVLTGFYEDSYESSVGDALTRYMPTMLATCAVKT